MKKEKDKRRFWLSYLLIVVILVIAGAVLIPLLIVFPMIFGLKGILFVGPVADTMASITAILMAKSEFKNMKQLEAENSSPQCDDPNTEIA